MNRSISFALAAAITALSANPVVAETVPQVVHVEILGANAPELQKFYKDLFAWDAKVNPVGYGYVPVAPAAPVTLTGGIGPNPQKRPLVTFYVKVDDPAAVLKRAVELGGKVAMPATDVSGDITFARFSDPEGNVIGLVRRPN